MFDIPKYCLESFLALASYTDTATAVGNWGVYMDSINRAESLIKLTASFPVHSEVLERLRCERPSASPDDLRHAMLTELFTAGISVQATCADRVTVERIENSFVVHEESIGRMRNWCWIDQRSSVYFPVALTMNAMVHIEECIRKQQMP